MGVGSYGNVNSTGVLEAICHSIQIEIAFFRNYYKAQSLDIFASS